MELTTVEQQARESWTLLYQLPWRSGVKPDAPPGLLWRRHELADGVEHNAKPGIVFSLQPSQPLSQVLRGGDHPPKPHEGPHDFNIDRDSALTVQPAVQVNIEIMRT